MSYYVCLPHGDAMIKPAFYRIGNRETRANPENIGKKWLSVQFFPETGRISRVYRVSGGVPAQKGVILIPRFLARLRVGYL